MSQENINFRNLLSEYFDQWAWFRQYNYGDPYTPRDSWEEELQREFEERKQAFTAIVDQIEATPMSHYFCWAEAEFDENNDMLYRLNPESMICVKVNGISERRAEMILNAAAFEFRDNLLSYNPDDNSICGRYCVLNVSCLDFVLLHRYVHSRSFPNPLVDLFPASPPLLRNHDIPFDALEYWKNRSLQDLEEKSEIHAMRLQRLGASHALGDRFLTHVMSCVSEPQTGLVEYGDFNSSNAHTQPVFNIKNYHTEIGRIGNDFIDNSVHNDINMTNTTTISASATTSSTSSENPYTNVSIQDLELQLPPLPDHDEGDQNWITAKELSKISGNPATDSLCSYRSRGVKNDEKTVGRDERGMIWRKKDQNSKAVFYLRSSISKNIKH